MAGAAGENPANGDLAPMQSMAEFTQQMKADAEQQQCLVPIVAKLLAKLVEENDKLPADKEITVFHAQKAPAVGVLDYAERIAKYSSCSYCCFVVGVIYMDRFIRQQRALQREFRVNSLNVHRLMLSSIMVAAKFLDDFYYSNEFWAKIGGVPNSELNTLELEFLFLTNFELHVKRETYDGYREELLAWSAGASGFSHTKSLVCEVRSLTVSDRSEDAGMEAEQRGSGAEGDAMIID
mmetsp:Transcript_69111/g.144093  ORF Transcript_69111/g.144093 Transcript_69111/m.144093 type:complete len:237 (-) Transcript_69111:18-728(-)|eukprot:CAMPEP_0181294686 /NCGR_PEP_ID=MMETSP1101-20121128/3741_1 /TAXON_ID=46948 /ORGANISM="Rhodomonas abbreviata, Strain Caron Lab Isolate" /LENGTH=236 /DNA_ID=CAMNT_0023399377 /DNA_START=259 /DNA_END=969 /DNA_ORIENTATION=-